MLGNHFSRLCLMTVQIILAYVPSSTCSSLLSLRTSATSNQMSMKIEPAQALRRTIMLFPSPSLMEILSKSTNLRLRGGAKSKNHTNHNQNAKAHRNGIKRVKT